MRSVGRRNAVVAIVALVASALGACTLLNPLGGYGPGAGPTADGGAVPDGASTDGRACVLARWPGRPATDGPGIGDVVLALESINLGTAEAPKVTGYDLDGVCTCPEPPSCIGAPTAKVVCDADGGADLGGTDTLLQIFQTSGEEANVLTLLSSGFHGIVLRIRDYNGLADDAKVEVDTFVSGGTEGIQSGTPAPPRHDGTDVWTVDPASLFAPSVPPYLPAFADGNAYVAGGVLVAAVDFPLHLGGLALDLHGSVLTGTLRHRAGEPPTSFHIDDGQVAGREAASALLTNLDIDSDPFADDRGLCGDSGTYQLLKTKICDAVDLQSDPKRDNQNAPCDALGLTFAFTSGPAQLGSAYAPAPRMRLCGDTWHDDCAR